MLKGILETEASCSFNPIGHVTPTIFEQQIWSTTLGFD